MSESGTTYETEMPRWRRVYEALRARVESGEYPPDSRVPSIVAVAEEFHVAQVTAQKALAELRARGYTYTEPGIGSFVRGGSQ